MNPADHYELATGGVTKAVTRRVLALFLESELLDDKDILDNACGSGVVTKEILRLSDKVREIDAVDISPAMVGALQSYLSAAAEETAAGVPRVKASVMDARVSYLACHM
jgi:ubiquinone/menaquinone biosynthesis C-methylase UbiE